ncbi:MAG TPA: protein-L-isoaspartate(D-aspartate) O-methyltransferase [Haliangiales bacterium]|nr:protein-L-isoaspartate(D-aspartate) O-methyltransferase [Haliangiales bacterium]
MDAPERRRRMVERQIAARGLSDPAVLAAMLAVPREAFVPSALAAEAYEDTALPTDEGQTISQPYIVALMTAALAIRPGDKVLEVGTGSGYGAAVLAHIAAEVDTIEIREPLARAAEARLRELGVTNVRVRVADGAAGWPEHAPYDAVSVTAGSANVPPALLEQLAVGGRLVMPVGAPPFDLELVRLTRRPDGTFRRDLLGGVQFVPLVGGGR